MGIGRIAYEDWNAAKLQSLSYYEFLSCDSNSELRIGIVTDLDFTALISPLPCNLTKDDEQLLSRFTQLVHENMFGTSPPDTRFKLFFAISTNGMIDLPRIKSIVNFMPRVYLDVDKHEPVPFIVYSTTSKRHHLV
jgi:hypothetical protein